ncbi:ABC transporter ATP-binding protein [Pseudoruegeria sp. HB172150]|uniref:ABC transporter ATP-binding protein n=1 Tax=Pseudoruegeria sp. HB172150 TaxID=2721164 RepID=UPI001557090C|nr:oligopeptide/dipeptide ABC transporter ATP-binding protein [Pseudoruegeria sp. HB172150]
MKLPAATVKDLHVTFGGTVRAVDGVTFTVEDGEIFGVIGESGSGKSTLGRCLVCLINPSDGEVRHRDVDPFALSRRQLNRHRRRCQMVSQDPNAALDPRMTILQSLCEPLNIAGIGSREKRREKAYEMLDRVSLAAEFANRYPHELSGGQKQRVNIARALMLDPELIVCDEVVAALDVSIQADMLNLFSRLKDELKLTYVFISHDLRVVSHISDRVAVMYFGTIVELGPAREVMDRPLHPYTEALGSAEPKLAADAAERRGRIILQGEIPNSAKPPTGCRFHTRCPRAEARCSGEVPATRELMPGRYVACHFAEEMLARHSDTTTIRPGDNGARAATAQPVELRHDGRA